MGLSYASALIEDNGTIAESHNVAECKRTGPGAYMINYVSDFAASSGPQATPWGKDVSVGVNIMAKNTCEVLLTDKNGLPADTGFSFLVMGQH